MKPPVVVTVVPYGSTQYAVAVGGRALIECVLEVALGWSCSLCDSEARAFRPRDVVAPPLCGSCVVELFRAAWVLALVEGRVGRN